MRNQELPEIGEHTTINELADIVRQLEQSLTLRIYDDHNEVFGAIRLVSADELNQIDRLCQQPEQTAMH
jgi:16S rRNA C1402 N4-methylase RsmH